MKLPNKSQWKRILKVFHKKEKVSFFVLSGLFLCSAIILISGLYLQYTKPAPKAGGSYIEGAVGQPRFLNPVYGDVNDVDRDLIELVFSGLMTYDNNGNLVNDLTESYKISEDGRNYEFTLRNNIFWHDGKSLTAEDVIFTIKTIQNSDYKSPLRANWIDVDTELVSEKVLRIKLKGPYNSFLENCTLKIMPKHIWENILPENFSLSSYNLQPIGSGPYKFNGLKQSSAGFITSLSLKANAKYYKQPAFISNIVFNFFENRDNLLRAASGKSIDGFSSVYLSAGTSAPKSLTARSFAAPRYFSVFFNIADSELFSDQRVRQALNYATDKADLLQKINDDFSKNGAQNFQIVDSPVIPDFFGYAAPTTPYNVDLEKAKTLLDKAGFKANEQGLREKSINKKPAFRFTANLATGSKSKEVEELQKCLAKDPEIFQGDVTGYFGNITKEAVTKFQQKYSIDVKNFGSVGATTRAKLNELCVPPPQLTLPLKITLTTVNQPIMARVAEILKSQWEQIGATVEINLLSIQDLKPIIKDRSYDALLYGESLGMLIDPYPFWHSSQKLDPGLNLSGYENQDADKLLKDARETLEEGQRQKDYEKFQDTLIADAPAIFLYNSSYVYFLNSKIQGIETTKIADPAKRFSNIEEWYIKTKRIFNF